MSITDPRRVLEVKRDGLLVLNATTQKSILATLTLGLVDGWWLYADESLRLPGSRSRAPPPPQRWRWSMTT